MSEQPAKIRVLNQCISPASKTFVIGRISMLDLNDARQSKDYARQARISELYRLWYYYYQLRSLTLWDWERNEPLEADFDAIIHRKENF